MVSESTEDPRPSPKKKRNPQSRDHMAKRAESMGLGLGCGRSFERAIIAVKRSKDLRERGYTYEGTLMEDAINVSKRGAWEIARLSDEVLFSLCKMVKEGDACNLVEALRLVRKVIKAEQDDPPVQLLRAKNGMYRITSEHNHSSVTLSAQDLIELSELLLYIMPELQQKVSEDPGTSPVE